MITCWEWQWIIGRNVVVLTFDLRSFMVGICVGPRDIVIHVGMFTLAIEYWPHEVSK